MTQIATPESVRADFDGVAVDAAHGGPMRLERRGDEFWAEFDDPGWEGDPRDRPRITRQVVMITGSHHQNIYWYSTGHDRALNVLPGVYLLDEERWTPRNAVVLAPPGRGVAMLDGHWNAVCIDCHTTHGKTRFDTPFRSEPIRDQTVDTTVAELGIACEACHGPAGTHVAANRNPVRRYGLHAGGGPDPTIVEPTRLDPQRSSQVCGQCHSIWEFPDTAGERAASAGGLPYRPGDELRETRFVAQPRVNGRSEAMQALIATDPDFVRGSFWADGLVRVSGREYNGLIDSPCFAGATDPERTLSCFSCHTMHKTPEDPRTVAEWAATHQVSAGMDGDAACTQCHDGIARNVAGMPGANTTEADPRTPFPVISLLSEQQGVHELGGTMRLGGYDCRLVPGTRAHAAYGRDVVRERHRHRYEVNGSLFEVLERHGLRAAGHTLDGELVEIVEVDDHPWMVGAQFHPEFTSRPGRPNPLFRDFVGAAVERARGDSGRRAVGARSAEGLGAGGA